MMVRARDNIYRMKDLKGKKIGLTKSLNMIKNDWWRIQEEQGIELMLMLNDMTRKDVEIVEFLYPDDWYDDPKMLEPMGNPSELWLKRDHKHDFAFRPLETALEKGIVDAIYTQSVPSSIFRRRRASSRRPRIRPGIQDWTLQVANVSAVITCTEEMAEKHPELIVTFMKGMIKVGRWANEHKHAAVAILDKQTFYLDVEDTYRNIKDIDMVPNLSSQNLAAIEIGKDFMLSHRYIKNDFNVYEWAAPEFLEQAAKELLEEKWQKVTSAKLPEVVCAAGVYATAWVIKRELSKGAQHYAYPGRCRAAQGGSSQGSGAQVSRQMRVVEIPSPTLHMTYGAAGSICRSDCHIESVRQYWMSLLTGAIRR